MTSQVVNPPKADQVVVVKKGKDKSFKLLVVVLIIVSFALSGLNVYLYLFNRRTVEREILAVTTEQDNTQSALAVENLKLMSVRKQAKAAEDLTQERWSSAQKVFELKSDGTVISTAQDENFPALPILFKKEKFEGEPSWDLASLNQTELVETLEELLTDKHYEGLELDASLAVAKREYYDFIKQLSEILTPLDKKIIITSYPLWGDSVDYSYHKNYSEAFGVKLEWSRLMPYVDEVRFKVFDYTTCYSILAGPITPYSWAEKVIQYAISQGINREKLVVGISTLSYQWRDREYVEDDLDNFISDEQQCVIFSSEGTEDLLEDLQYSKQVDDTQLAEQRVVYSVDDSEYTLVNPTDEYIDSLVKLTADYGLKGVIYR